MSDGLTGGCLCGTVRYRLSSAPYGAGWCHCRICQRNSGSPAMAFASIALTDFLIEQGEGCIASFASSTTSERLFCKNCGTPLLVQDSIAPQSADFSLATLDDPAAATPGFHIYYNSRIAWAASADNLPCYPAGRDKDKI